MSDSAAGMAVGMLAIAATWSLASIVFVGLGLAFLRWARVRWDGAEGPFTAFWVGWVLTLGALQVWQLFRPVDGWARVFLVILGAAGMLWGKGALLAELRAGIRMALPFAGAAALFSLWMANRSMAPAMHYDAGLYHLGAVRWLTAYPIVPGLGNLHARLAYNISYFLYMAAMDFGPWAHRAQHVAAYLLLLALGVQIGWSGYLGLIQRRPLTAQGLFRLAMLPALADRIFAGVEDGEPDVAIWVMGVVLIDSLLRTVLEPRGTWQRQFGAPFVLMLSTAMITVKLSGLVLGAAACAVAIAWTIRRNRTPSLERSWLAGAFRAALPSAVLLGTWVIRGYVLSGYPAYPSTLGGANVDWRIPSETAREEARWITSWARIPGESPAVVLSDWRWLRPWSERMRLQASSDLVTPLAIAGVCVLVAAARRDPWSRRARELLAVAAVPAVALGAWFVTAPEPRFAGAAAWLLAACFVVIVGERWAIWRRRAFVVASILASLALGIVPHLHDEWRIRSGPERGFHSLPLASLVEVKLRSGLTTLQPAHGDQCWEGPLLCTPYPPLELRLRVAGKRSGGFTVAPIPPDS